MQGINRARLSFSVPRWLMFDRDSSRLVTLQIVAILLVAALLRFNQISQPMTDAFSWRQVSNAMIADNFYHRDTNIFYPEVSWNGSGPSYRGRELQTISYIAALLYTIFGQHDWVGRSVGVLFGLWGIFALYQLVRRVYDEEHAAAAALVLALLPGAIFIDRSFLPEPAMVALITTSLWMLTAYFQTEKLRYLVLACAAAALGILTRLPGVLIVVPMIYAGFALLERETLTESDYPWLLSLGLFSVTGVVFWYLDWTRQLATSYPPYQLMSTGTWVWADGLTKWLSRGYFISSALTNISSWLWTAPVIELVGLGLLSAPIGVWRGRSAAPAEPSNDEIRKAPWLFHWWLLGCVLYYLAGARDMSDYPWYFHIFSPAIAALAGQGLVLIWRLGTRNSRGRSALVLVGLTLVLIVGLGQRALQPMYDPPYAAQGYRLGLALHEITRPDDLIITLANDPRNPIALYYSQRRGWVFPPAEVDREWNWLPTDDDLSIQLFEQLRAKGAGWLGIVNDREDFWVEHPGLYNSLIKTIEFKAKTADYVIYRILTPDEVAIRSKK